MIQLLPAFIAIPLLAAFVLPLFGKKKDGATLLANIAIIALLVLSVLFINKTDVYIVGERSIPLGIDLVIDGLSSLLLLAVSVVSFAAIHSQSKIPEPLYAHGHRNERRCSLG